MIKLKTHKIGELLVLLSIVMFVLGIGAFTTQGEINKIHNCIGEFSFTWGLPTFIVGIIFIIISLFKKKQKLN